MPLDRMPYDAEEFRRFCESQVGQQIAEIAAERFDMPGCQMCGAHPDDPCDCHDPQEGP